MQMLDCDTVMRQLWDHLDGELTTERALLLAAHFTACQRCHPQLAFEQAFLTVLASTRSSGSHTNTLRQRVMAMLEAEGLLEAFHTGGYTDRHVFAVILAIGVKTLSNFTNHFADTPLDKFFQSRAWVEPTADRGVAVG
jgi:anti-sigma factor (TIGR02949 family)